MRCQSKTKAARRFGLIHETIWQLMHCGTFTLSDVVAKLYGVTKVHPQIKIRCRKMLEMYVAAGYLTQHRRPKDREWYFTVHVIHDPPDVVIDRREYLDALRDRNNSLYSKQTMFFDGILDETID